MTVFLPSSKIDELYEYHGFQYWDEPLRLAQRIVDGVSNLVEEELEPVDYEINMAESEKYVNMLEAEERLERVTNILKREAA